jgi:hypothetical protein
MSDIMCVHCRATWNARQLIRHGWAAISAARAMELGIINAYTAAHHGINHDARRYVSQRVYERTRDGGGCPHCGFQVRTRSPR